MMGYLMKFSEFIAKTEPSQEAPKGEVLDLSLGCQTCMEQVSEAEYFQQQRILKWTCSQGHLSYIEDWSLF